MTLEAGIEDSFKKIADLSAFDASTNLSTALGDGTKLSYFRLIDSAMTGDKIAIKQDSLFVTTQVADHGPISIIIASDAAANILEIAGAGTGDSAEVALSEEDINSLTNIITGAMNAVLERYKEIKEGFTLELSEFQSRLLSSQEDADLSLPEGVQDSVGLGFKIKLGTVDTAVQIEANSALVEFLVDELASAAAGVEIPEDSPVTEAATEETASSESEEQGEANSLEAVKESDDPGQQVDARRNLGFMSSVNMELVLELGRSEMPMRDVLTLTRGSAIELDRACSEPVDLYVHNQLVARGEVVAIDDNFGIKILELTGDLDLSKNIEALVR